MSRSGLSYLEKTSEDVFGTSIDIPSALNRRTVEVFLAGAAIAAGDWVALDIGEAGSARVIQVVQASTAANGNALVVGVALEAAAAAGAKLTVCTRGYVEGANVTAATAAGAALVVDATAGRADAIVAGDIAPPCGVSLETAGGGNTADVYVYGLAV